MKPFLSFSKYWNSFFFKEISSINLPDRFACEKGQIVVLKNQQRKCYMFEIQPNNFAHPSFNFLLGPARNCLASLLESYGLPANRSSVYTRNMATKRFDELTFRMYSDHSLLLRINLQTVGINGSDLAQLMECTHSGTGGRSNRWDPTSKQWAGGAVCSSHD